MNGVKQNPWKNVNCYYRKFLKKKKYFWVILGVHTRLRSTQLSVYAVGSLPSSNAIGYKDQNCS